jgi:nickel superoxide dismutase
MITKNYLLLSGAILLTLTTFKQNAFAHCEIPCGIYDDSVRIALLYEHITTIEKSMNEINEITQTDDVNYNQLVRWVVNQEEHAVQLQNIISQYFLHQRIKIMDISNEEAYNKYIEQLTLLHKLLVYAMKCKQTTDIAYINKMKDTLHSFEHAYFDK